MKSPETEIPRSESGARESAEKPRKRVLIIDDDHSYIDSMRGLMEAYYGDDDNIAVVECHSVDDARRAISSVSPNVIFLDHHFSRTEDDAGMVIAEEIRGHSPNVKIYSTTTDEYTAGKYADMGIEHVGKSDIAGMRNIIDSERRDA
ncbi:MAG: response regulator [Patescibacteria group bacterium]|nr:response regulator [Patescibacteria group bacterium]